MLGVPGLDPFGLVHALLGLSALVLGSSVVLAAKGTRRHRAIVMCWSYLGLVATFLSEIAVRVPAVGFGPAVIAATGVTVIGGGILIHTRVPPLVAAFVKPRRDDIPREPRDGAGRTVDRGGT